MLSTSNTTSTTHTLEVNVSNIEAVKGYVVISVYNSASSFPKENKQYKKVKIKVKQSSVKYTFNNLPEGNYAVAAYHDKNSDNECNLNFIGIPTEGYCFSKNFKPKFSAPTFNDVKFNLKSKYVANIKLIN
jgi:uncharacterized protein (DUF2141 family)